MSLQKYIQLLGELGQTRMSIGFRVLQFITPENLAEEQHSYRFGAIGNGHLRRDWNADWLVIGQDEMGFPVFADIKQEGWPVYTAAREEDTPWDVYKIAPNITTFFTFLRMIIPHCEGRDDMEKLRANPLDESKTDLILKKINALIEDGQVWYWELWLENYPAEDEDEDTFFA